LIFIISIIYNQRKYFEKLTITQFKKSKKKPKWDFNKRVNDKYPDKEQLYLLARFPTFEGVKGLIPKREYNLVNYSNCLGSYGLLYEPGDFVFSSAKIIETFLVNKSSLVIENIISATNFYETMVFSPYFPLKDSNELPYILHKLRKIYFRNSYLPYPIVPNKLIPILGNSICSYNTNEFTERYLRALIGELTFSYEFSYNHMVFQLLQDLMTTIRGKAQSEGSKEIKNFIDSFYKFNYGNKKGGESLGEFGYKGGNLGIIHTLINLGEGN